MEPSCDRELGVVERPRPVVVVEEELDLAEVCAAAIGTAGEEHVIGLFGAQLVRAERAGRPADRVCDIRLAGSVRADDHADARLEAHLDRIREGLEPTQLDGAKMHRGGGYRRPRTPLLRVVGGVSGERCVLVPIEELEDPLRLLAVRLLFLEADEAELGILRPAVCHAGKDA